MTIDDFTRAAWAKLIDREYLRELASGATPGPWENVWEEADEWYSITGQSYECYVCPEVATLTDETDADFIAAARTAVPALLDALEQAEARIQAVRDLHSPSDEQVIMGDCAAEECDHQEIEDCPTEPFTVCAECYRAAIELNPYYGEQGVDDVAWPCPTIRALGGKQ